MTDIEKACEAYECAAIVAAYTDWEQYRKNTNEFIDLAKRLSGQ